MTSRTPTHRMLRPQLGALLAAATLAACSSGDPIVDDGPRAAGVHLVSDRAALLTSLGDSAVLRPRVYDVHGATMGDVRLRWSVSRPGVLQQEGEGIFRAVGNGRVTIVAEVDPTATGVRPAGYWAGVSADTVEVEVRQRAVRLTLAPVDTAFATLGASRPLRVLVTDARGNPMVDGPPPLAWRSADARVVTVDDAGVVRSAGEGVAPVSVQAEDLIGALTFTVHPRLPHTSCMVYAQRGQAKQACVTLDLVLRERAEGGR